MCSGSPRYPRAPCDSSFSKRYPRCSPGVIKPLLDRAHKTHRGPTLLNPQTLVNPCNQAVRSIGPNPAKTAPAQPSRQQSTASYNALLFKQSVARARYRGDARHAQRPLRMRARAEQHHLSARAPLNPQTWPYPHALRARLLHRRARRGQRPPRAVVLRRAAVPVVQLAVEHLRRAPRPGHSLHRAGLRSAEHRPTVCACGTLLRTCPTPMATASDMPALRRAVATCRPCAEQQRRALRTNAEHPQAHAGAGRTHCQLRLVRYAKEERSSRPVNRLTMCSHTAHSSSIGTP